MNFLLSKLLPLIFSPLGLIFSLLFIFLIKKKKKYIYTAILFLYIFTNGIISSGLWTLLEYPLKRLRADTMESVDGIVVLSSGRHIPPGNTQIFEWNDPDRFLAGIELFKSGKGKKLIFTGGFNPLSSNKTLEGEIYLKEAALEGVPIKDILTTYQVINTYQEAKAVKELLKKTFTSKRNKIILITSAFHMKRAKKVFEREEIIVKPFPVDFVSKKNYITEFRNPLNWVPNSKSLFNNSKAIREIIGRIVYRIY